MENEDYYPEEGSCCLFEGLCLFWAIVFSIIGFTIGWLLIG